MYYQYFGLSEAPFSIAVNPRYLFMSPRHRDALAHLLYGVGAGGGFILLTGEVGTGKTTINRCLIQQLPDNADLAIVLNPALDARDLLATVCQELHIEPVGKRPGLKELTDALHRFLLANHRAGRKTVLMIDEAQHLDFDVLEQIRLLTNLETDEEKLLHIILIGQPELASKLARPELRQLNQRITARFDLQPLSRDETAAYVRHRLHVAGLPAGQALFSDGLLRAVYRESRGVPRLINLICDRMLLGAYGQNRSVLDRRLLGQAVREVTGAGRRESRVRSWLVPGVAVLAVLLVGTAIVALLRGGGAEAPPSPPTAQTARSAGPAAAVEPVPSGEPATQAAGGAQQTGGDWRLSPRAGRELLRWIYGVRAGGAGTGVCDGLEDGPVRCSEASGLTWNDVLREDRPTLLQLVDEHRFETRALLVGVDAQQALLATRGGIERVDLRRVAESWTGVAWHYWTPPDGMHRTLGRGDRGADVREAARLFAQLDEQVVPLTDDVFDARLETRTRLFQRRHGLRDDGVMGAQTLRALVLAAGEDLDLASARRRLEQRSASLQMPRDNG